MALSAPEEVQEAATKIKFSTSIDGELSLIGTGCRYKWGMVKVYAVGIYIQGEVGSLGGAGLRKGLVESTAKKSVVMKMARGIDSQKLVDALDEAFKPRLALPGRSAASLAKFMEVVQEVAGGQCDEGDEFVFTITGGNTLTVTAKKMKQQGAVVHGKQGVVDADIAFALFDTYLGGTLPEVAPTLTADINRTLAV